MTPNRKNIRVSKQKRHPSSEQASLLQRFYDLKIQIIDSDDYLRLDESASVLAARKLGVSLSSIYRWQRVLGAEKPSTIQPLAPDIFTKLISKSASCRLEAALRLACWMRWPTQPKDQQIGFLACASSYLGQTQPNTSLAGAHSALADVLRNELNCETISQFMTGNGSAPMFELIPYRDEGWDDIDVYVDTVGYLLAHGLESTGGRNAPSLNKVAYLIEERLMRTSYTSRTFLGYWQEMGAAAPLWYVARHRHSTLDWALNPGSQNFSGAVDRLIADPLSLRVFVSHCRWVVEELQRILPKRSSIHASLPVFPQTITPKSLQIPRLSKVMSEKLQGYRK